MLGSTEVLDGPVGVDPDPLPLDQRPFAVVPLVTDVQDGVVVELHREVVPHAAHHVGALPDAVALGFPHRAGCPRSGRDTRGHSSGVTANSVPADREGARPEAGLGQTLGVEDHPSLAAQVLTGLGHGRNVTLPRHVHGHIVLGRVDDEPQATERLEHLYVERAHRQVGPIGQRRRRPHDVLRVAQPHVDERVDHAQVRVLAEPEDGGPFGAGRVHVEVVAVVEVAIAGPRMCDELRRLMNGKVVP